MEGRDIRTRDAVIRYLGVFLGVREEVARKFLARTTQRIEDRLRIWKERGVPHTRRGRGLWCGTA